MYAFEVIRMKEIYSYPFPVHNDFLFNQTDILDGFAVTHCLPFFALYVISDYELCECDFICYRFELRRLYRGMTMTIRLYMGWKITKKKDECGFRNR